MALYLVLILPALFAALWSGRLSRQRLVMVWVATVLLMAWLMPIGSRDYTTYLKDFTDINKVTFADAIHQDPVYTCAVWLFGHLGWSAEPFYLLISSAGLWVKFTALGRLSGRSSMVLLLYVCSYFFLQDFTQLRAGLAIGIWMHALADLPYSRRRYLLLTTVASLIHLQAALGFVLLAVLALARKRLGGWLLIAGAVIIVAAGATNIFDRLGYAVLAAIPDPRVRIYFQMASEDLWVRPNPYSLISLLALVTALSGLYLERQTSKWVTMANLEFSASRAVFVALLLGTCALSLFSSVSVAAFRISENFFALLPVGVWLVASRVPVKQRVTGLLWILAALLAYNFLFYGPYLLNPATGHLGA